MLKLKRVLTADASNFTLRSAQLAGSPPVTKPLAGKSEEHIKVFEIQIAFGHLTFLSKCCQFCIIKEGKAIICEPRIVASIPFLFWLLK